MAEQTASQMAVDPEYITVAQICKELEVDRSLVKRARETGRLPGAIAFEFRGFITYKWKRSDIEPHLNAWKLQLDRIRGDGQWAQG